MGFYKWIIDSTKKAIKSSEKSIKILEKINEKNEIILKDLSKLFDNSIINNVNELIYKEYIEIKEEVFSSYSQKFQNFYSINSSIEIKSLKLRSDKQKKIMDYFVQKKGRANF